MIDVSQVVIAVDTQRVGESIIIRPMLQSPSALTLQYRMTVRQSSSNGTSSINQNGELHSGTDASVVQLSMPAGASCQVHLEVFQDDTLLKQVDSACD
ncbi:hypothetical protein KDX38_18550 [Pseudomonas sp. CDFA 602]|uniref:curli-like amyloid fiber formation chaperone CsgH n=1 Tax=Pseudomonas californiensis TaxID=2829823 RepID=UPI001E2C52D6|nr:curli-like amyloid fiber formation chaperone CsgH [Pseudomonas californiensis]MCD5995615.1 hypothetical protein [Pseudomonas californiensis]MCD6001209.1 hypothetical protein [Pseudomonas californiensis]